MQDGIVLKEIAKEETQIFSSREYDLSLPPSFVICLQLRVYKELTYVTYVVWYLMGI
jgi:hypothetical protein